MKQDIYSRFAKISDELLRLLSSLSQEELNTVPFEKSWTAAQVGDHLYKSYAVAQTLNGAVAPAKRPVDQMVDGLSDVFLDFNSKMESPDFIIPSNDFIDKEALLKGLRKRINEIKEVAGHKDLTLTCLDFELPGAGKLTRLEWINFVIVHTQRHVHQLKNIISKLDQR